MKYQVKVNNRNRWLMRKPASGSSSALICSPELLCSLTDFLQRGVLHVWAAAEGSDCGLKLTGYWFSAEESPRQLSEGTAHRQPISLSFRLSSFGQRAWDFCLRGDLQHNSDIKQNRDATNMTLYHVQKLLPLLPYT